MFGKNPYQVLTEACKTECGECDDMYEDEIEDEFEDELDDIEELEESIFYTAEMIPVIEQHTDNGVRYLIEMDNLTKFMESNHIEDIAKAMELVGECNGLESSTLALVIESDDVAEELIEEAKNEKRAKGSKKKLGVMKDAKKLLSGLKIKGIKVVKKKGNGKSKSKKK